MKILYLKGSKWLLSQNQQVRIHIKVKGRQCSDYIHKFDNVSLEKKLSIGRLWSGQLFPIKLLNSSFHIGGTIKLEVINMTYT